MYLFSWHYRSRQAFYWHTHYLPCIKCLVNDLNKCWMFFRTVNNCLYNIGTPLLTVYKSQCLKTTCWMFWHDGHVFIVRRIRSFYLYRNSDKLCKLCRVSAYTRHLKPYISLLNWNARPNTAIFYFIGQSWGLSSVWGPDQKWNLPNTPNVVAFYAWKRKLLIRFLSDGHIRGCWISKDDLFWKIYSKDKL